MAINAGRLVVLLNADPRVFNRQIRKASREMQKLARQMRRARDQLVAFGRSTLRVARNLALFSAPILALAGAAGIVRVTQRTLQWSRQLDDLALKTNIQIQQLQRYQLLLQGTGIEIEQFADVLNTLAERLVEFQRGESTAQDAFRQLGLESELLTGQIRTQQQALQALARQYQAISRIDPTLATASLSELVGGGAALRLEPLLRRFGDDLAANADAVTGRAGGVISEADQLNLNRAVEALISIRRTLENGLRRFVAQFADDIANLAQALDDALSDGFQEFFANFDFNQLRTTFIEIGGRVIAVLLVIAGNLELLVNTLRSTLRNLLTATLVAVTAGVVAIFAPLAGAVGALIGGIVLLVRAATSWGRVVSAFQRLGQLITRLVGGGAGRVATRTRESLFFHELRQGFNRLFTNLGNGLPTIFQRALQALAVVGVVGIVESVTGLIGRVIDFVATVFDPLDVISTLQQNYQQLLPRILEDLRNALGAQEEAIQQVDTSAQDLATAMAAAAQQIRTRFVRRLDEVLQRLTQRRQQQQDRNALLGLTQGERQITQALQDLTAQLQEPLRDLDTNIARLTAQIGRLDELAAFGPLDQASNQAYQLLLAQLQQSRASQQQIAGVIEVLNNPQLGPRTEIERQYVAQFRQIVEAINQRIRRQRIGLRIGLQIDAQQTLANLRTDFGQGIAQIEQEVADRFRNLSLLPQERRSEDLFAQAVAPYTQQINRLQRELGSLQSEIQITYAQAEQDIDGARQRLVELVTQHRILSGALGDTQEAYHGVADAAKEFAEVTANNERIAMQFEELGRSIQSNLEGAFEAILFEGQKLGDAFKALVAEIIREILRIAIIRPLVQNITTAFGFGAAAQGGFVSGATLVGQRGPEIVDFNNPGRVYSNRQLRQAFGGSGGGGTGMSLTFNIQSSDGPGVRAAIAEATPQIIEASNGRVYNALADRNSSVSQLVRQRARE